MVYPVQPPPPHRLSRAFEAGQITRAEFQRQMEVHARGLIEEMVQSRAHPVAAFIESIRNRRAAAKLASRHGEIQVRSVLAALAEIPDFPPANLLWNARDHQTPLFCFLRGRIPPTFRVHKLEVGAFEAEADIEYQFGPAQDPTREIFTFLRDPRGGLQVEGRRRIRVR